MISKILRALCATLILSSLITNLCFAATKPDSSTLITAYYQAIESQHLDKFMDLLSDKVVHDINEGETEIGKDKFKTFMMDQFSHGKIKIKDLIILTSSDGQYAMSRFICSGTYDKSIAGYPKAHGQKWEIPVVSYFKIENNKISQVAVYYNLKNWVNQLS